MYTENETILHADPDDDDSAKARNCDDAKQWTVETYSAKVAKALVMAHATEKSTHTDGRVFVCDAKQLIEFIAASSGLVVEFRKHKKRQLSEETKTKLTERLRRMRQQPAL